MENMEKSEYSEFAKEIEKMGNEDQAMRLKELEQNKGLSDPEGEALDRKNTERMKEIIQQMGWPTISKVGAEISNMAWLLVQHADHDVNFQEQCLELIKQQPEGEISKRNIAYLEDRVRVNQGQPQLYGTQFTDKDQPYGPRPIEDAEHVDDRRKALGMETLEEYAKILKEKYKKF